MSAIECKKITASGNGDKDGEDVPDGGYGWVIMACCFLIQFVTNGIYYSTGIWVVEFEENLGLSKRTATLTASINAALLCMMAPVGSALANWLGARLATFCGCLIAGVSFALASFSKSTVMLLFSFGIPGGVGLSFGYTVSSSVAALYFNKRIAIALGVVMCGTALGPIAFPFIIRILIDKYSWRGAMIILGSLLVQCCLFAALIIPVEKLTKRKHNENQELLKPSSISVCRDILECSMLKDRLFILRLVCAFLWFFGAMTMWVLLPDYANELDMSKLQGAQLVSAVGFGYAAGRMVASTLMAVFPLLDRYLMHKTSLVLGGGFLIGFQIDNSFVTLAFFSIIIGFFDGLSMSTLLLVTADFQGRERLVSAFAYFLFFMGMGNLCGPYISGVLFQVTQSYSLPFYLGGFLYCLSGLIQCPMKCKRRSLADQNQGGL